MKFTSPYMVVDLRKYGSAYLSSIFVLISSGLWNMMPDGAAARGVHKTNAMMRRGTERVSRYHHGEKANAEPGAGPYRAQRRA